MPITGVFFKQLPVVGIAKVNSDHTCRFDSQTTLSYVGQEGSEDLPPVMTCERKAQFSASISSGGM